MRMVHAWTMMHIKITVMTGMGPWKMRKRGAMQTIPAPYFTIMAAMAEIGGFAQRLSWEIEEMQERAQNRGTRLRHRQRCNAPVVATMVKESSIHRNNAAKKNAKDAVNARANVLQQNHPRI